MEFTVDVAALRTLLQTEYRRMRAEIETLGPLSALQRSQSRHDAALAAAADAGTLACDTGCSWCCHFTVDARAAEVAVLVDYLRTHLSESEQARIADEAETNRQSLERMEAADRAHSNLKCPFLVAGQCGVYPVRPQTCRNYHATDSAGCRLAFEQPENDAIDPDFAPGVYQAGQAHVEAVAKAMGDAGYDTDVYELNAALSEALRSPAFANRIAPGVKAMLSTPGQDVPLEWTDLAE